MFYMSFLVVKPADILMMQIIDVLFSDCGTIVDGFLPDLQDCSKFIQCSQGVAYPKQCNAGLHWNTQILACDWPANAGCTIQSGGCKQVLLIDLP